MENIYEFYNLIGKNIKNIRTQNGDTQEILAEKLNISRGFLSHLESQKVNKGISLDTLYYISKEYNVDITIFFEGYNDL